MLKLNVNQEKQLTFEVQIGGVQSEQVSSHLRIMIDEIEYGFPAEIGRESISVSLPPLRTVTARKLKEGEEVQVKLEIIADGNYLTPWQDTFRLSNPLVVEAKIVDDDFNPAPAFKTRLVQEGKHGDQKQGVKLEKVEESDVSMSDDDLTEKIVNKLAEKLSGSFGTKPINEQVKPKKDEDENEDEDEVEELDIHQPRPQGRGGFGSIAGKSSRGGFGSISGRPRESKEKIITKQDILNMTESDIYAYMERAGTKNPQVQKIVYNQAESIAESSRPVDILKQVVKILKSKK